MLTPEEKKQIREIVDNVYPYPYGDKEIERQYCTEGMAIEREADAYGKGMEDGILQERERREAEIARIKDLLRDSVISYGITDGLGGLSKEEYWQEYKKENNL